MQTRVADYTFTRGINHPVRIGVALANSRYLKLVLKCRPDLNMSQPIQPLDKKQKKKVFGLILKGLFVLLDEIKRGSLLCRFP